MTFGRRWRSSNKFGAVKVSHAGRSFHSKLEAAVYDILKLREASGEISDINCQVSVRMEPFDIRWIPDFSFIDTKTGLLRYCEAKGVEGERFVIILKLWRTIGPAPLELWKGSCTRPKLVETIYPTGGLCTCQTKGTSTG